MSGAPKNLSLTLELDPARLNDDLSLIIGYANLHAWQTLDQTSPEFASFHDALGRIYNHLHGIKLAQIRAARGAPGAAGGEARELVELKEAAIAWEAAVQAFEAGPPQTLSSDRGNRERSEYLLAGDALGAEMDKAEEALRQVVRRLTAGAAMP